MSLFYYLCNRVVKVRRAVGRVTTPELHVKRECSHPQLEGDSGNGQHRFAPFPAFLYICGTKQQHNE